MNRSAAGPQKGASKEKKQLIFLGLLVAALVGVVAMPFSDEDSAPVIPDGDVPAAPLRVGHVRVADRAQVERERLVARTLREVHAVRLK